MMKHNPTENIFISSVALWNESRNIFPVGLSFHDGTLELKNIFDRVEFHDATLEIKHIFEMLR